MIENEIVAIAAMGLNREIGKDGKMLWYEPADLQHFRNKTEGQFVMMGKKTFYSLPIKPLPNRRNIVVTSDYSDLIPYMSKGFLITCTDPEVAMRCTPGTLFVIGGQQLYNTTMHKWDRVILTRLNKSFPEADTYFPIFEHNFNLDKEEVDGHLTYCYYSRRSKK